MRRLIPLLVLVAALAGAPTLAAQPVTTVPSVDIQRYLGDWKQLAAIPQPFAAQCVRNTAANYTLLPDGLVRVLNTCTTADGSTSSAEGRARIVDPTTNAKLQVTFAQIGGQFIFVPGGDYWIIGLERSYRWAVVGDPNRNTAFVLSRTATLPARDIVRIIGVLLRNGYDPTDLELTPQDGQGALGPLWPGR